VQAAQRKWGQLSLTTHAFNCYAGGQPDAS